MLLKEYYGLDIFWQLFLVEFKEEYKWNPHSILYLSNAPTIGALYHEQQWCTTTYRKIGLVHNRFNFSQCKPYPILGWKPWHLPPEMIHIHQHHHWTGLQRYRLVSAALSLVTCPIHPLIKNMLLKQKFMWKRYNAFLWNLHRKWIQALEKSSIES